VEHFSAVIERFHRSPRLSHHRSEQQRDQQPVVSTARPCRITAPRSSATRNKSSASGTLAFGYLRTHTKFQPHKLPGLGEVAVDPRGSIECLLANIHISRELCAKSVISRIRQEDEGLRQEVFPCPYFPGTVRSAGVENGGAKSVIKTLLSKKNSGAARSHYEEEEEGTDVVSDVV